jgi:hypothetical protein
LEQVQNHPLCRNKENTESNNKLIFGDKQKERLKRFLLDPFRRSNIGLKNAIEQAIRKVCYESFSFPMKHQLVNDSAVNILHFC